MTSSPGTAAVPLAPMSAGVPDEVGRGPESALQALLSGLAALPPGPDDALPQAGLELLRQSGFWGAGLSSAEGGPTLGETGLLRLLRRVGRASLPLGRLYEGHVNALALVRAYGTPDQRAQAATDVRGGHLFGVWNTEGPDGVRLLEETPGVLTLQGAKTFASGGRSVTRPLLPVDGPHGRQLVLLRSEDPQSRVHEVPGSWQPLGMAATVSVKLDFSGSVVQPEDLIGGGGDYYRQPMFSTGALRFCAVQLGGADALLDETRRYLELIGRLQDEVQALRFAEAWLGLQAATLSLAEGQRLSSAVQAGGAGEDRLLAQVDAVRLATEDACLRLLEAAERAVGARGLQEPFAFPRLIRDLRMYLRQPAPDAARLRLGRWVLEPARSGEPDDLQDGGALE